MRIVHSSIGGDYKPGDPPPTGYNAWHEWADVQIAAGLRQQRCAVCGLYRFPQELSGEFSEYEGETSRGERVTVRSPICKACVEKR